MGLFKNFKETLENKVNGWLFKEEIEAHQQEMAKNPRNQIDEKTEEELKKEIEMMRKVQEEQINLIKSEDHSKVPSQNDINRYHGYHVNFVENMHMIEKHSGQKCPFNVPAEPLGIVEFSEMAKEKGWNGMRMSCGLPTGDLGKPRKPWTMGDSEKKWSTKEDPEIYWKQD